MLPRFRGSAIEADNKWGWELLLTFMGDGSDGLGFSSKEVFNTKEEAIKNMMEAIKEITIEIEDRLNLGIDTSKFIDMKTNETINTNKSEMQ